MNDSSASRDPAAEERASFWAARLDGSRLTPSDQVALDAWLGEHPAHRALLAQYCQLSADLERRLAQLAAAGNIELPREFAPRRRTRWGFAVALAAAAVVAVLLWSGRTRTQSAQFATAAAPRQSLTLADGTRVELNAQTSLQVELGRAERRVRLADGEAFFSVSKDPARPFVVETPAGSVRVTGTIFNVHAETTSALEVLVVEGKVQVRTPEAGAAQPGGLVALAAGDKLTSRQGANRVERLEAPAIEDALAWRQGQAVFAGVPLSAALDRFARYHGRRITSAPEVQQLSVGGRFSLDDLDGFLEALEAILPVRVTRDLSGGVRVESAKTLNTQSVPAGP
jgi:transmembrane sensor